jgi:hypothetical protein
MALFTIDPLAIVTFQRLSAVRAFIDLLDASLPEVELRQREKLDQLAKDQGWEFGDYSVENQLLYERFGHWMPRLSAYSVIVLLQSVVETQLLASAERVCHEHPPPFNLRELLANRGGTIDVAVRYLLKIRGVDVKQDPAWDRLMDLQNLRDIIVHRGGTRGESEKHQATFDRLIQRYGPRLAQRENAAADWLYSEVWVSLPFCREFSQDVGRFFARTLKAIGVDEEVIPKEYLTSEGAA